MKNVIIAFCLMVVVSAACASGAELLVPSQYPTIQSAIDAAVDGDTVIVAPGTYTGTGNCDIGLAKTITVRSEEGPETCIIDCNNPKKPLGFYMSNGTLAGLTITGAYRSAVYCTGRAKLINCILTGNRGMDGGAVLCRGNLEIINCSLTNNSVVDVNRGRGGTIFCENGLVLVSNCTISGNSAATGGGIYGAKYSNITIKDCVISNNNAAAVNLPWAGGGGIYCEYGSIVVISSDISRNSSLNGAAIYCNEATSVFVSDCNIHDNVAEGVGGGLAGGGIYYKTTSSPMGGATFTVINSSITDNTVKGADSKGGGLYIKTATPSQQNVNILLTGCVVARNSAQVSDNKSSFGGGLYCNSRILLTETTIRENTAVMGGGIYNAGPGITLSRCRISGNSAIKGSAIRSETGELYVENCVVSGNKGLKENFCPAIDSGFLSIANCTIVGNYYPAIMESSLLPTNPPSSITNSIIYWNCRDHKCYGLIPSKNISVSYSDVQGSYAGTGNIDANPCFVTAGYWDTNGTPRDYRDDFWVDGDYRLTAVSPCIDSGGFVFLMDNKDLAGNPRITGAAIDMGAYEYQNTPPVAAAGPNQTAYAWIDGFADVNLDGSGSYDDDNDILDYYWSWTIDDSNYESNGINPTIKLPVGNHTIELVVDDGIDFSEPDYCTITVIGAVRGRLTITPCVLETKSHGKWILAALFIPPVPGEKVNTNEPLRLYPGDIEAKHQQFVIYGRLGHSPTIALALFDKQQVIDALGPGQVEVSVVGEFLTGRFFFGSDTIKIIAPPHRPPYH